MATDSGDLVFHSSCGDLGSFGKISVVVEPVLTVNEVADPR